MKMRVGKENYTRQVGTLKKEMASRHNSVDLHSAILNASDGDPVVRATVPSNWTMAALIYYVFAWASTLARPVHYI